MLYDVIGIIGVMFCLLAYALLSLQIVKSTQPIFSIFNLIGSALIVISLVVDWNLPAFIMESSWCLLSIIGLVRSLQSAKKPI